MEKKNHKRNQIDDLKKHVNLPGAKRLLPTLQKQVVVDAGVKVLLEGTDVVLSGVVVGQLALGTQQ